MRTKLMRESKQVMDIKPQVIAIGIQNCCQNNGRDERGSVGGEDGCGEAGLRGNVFTCATLPTLRVTCLSVNMLCKLSLTRLLHSAFFD
jgi:hypothetical protein